MLLNRKLLISSHHGFSSTDSGSGAPCTRWNSELSSPYGRLAVFTTATSGVQPERASPRRKFYLRTGLPILAVRRDHAAFVRQSKRGFLVLHDCSRKNEARTSDLRPIRRTLSGADGICGRHRLLELQAKNTHGLPDSHEGQKTRHAPEAADRWLGLHARLASRRRPSWTSIFSRVW
jgi:hypothetical protein